MGNPPFVGARLMSDSQKEDVFSIFGNTKNAGNLDYVSCWYKKAADLMQGTNIHAALVSTNSITQGEQVAILWKALSEQGIKIDFAYRTFRWDSEANLKAHVHCVIVGFSGRANGSFAKTENLATPYTHNRGYLPHIENKQLQFITYRLYDSVPAEKITQWKEELHILENIDSNDPKMQKLRKKISKYEDAGYGQCFLKNDKIAKIVQDNLLHFNDERYILHNWCIMPNHVHVLIEVKSGFTLSEILHGWKSYTAKEANKILGRTGTFWQEEYFDRYIRNEEHYKNVMEYIDNNPVKAGFVKKAEDWKWGKSAFCRNANGSGNANGSFANTGSSNTDPSITSVVVNGSSQASRADCSPTKKIFLNDSQFIEAKNINGYLLDAPDIFIESRAKPLCDIPEIGIGNKPIDGGNYLFTEEEKTAFIKKEPQSEKYFKKWLGADEFINRYYRYCLWLGDCSPSEIKKMPESFRRVQAVREFRLASTSRPTQKLADTPTRFHVENFPKSTYLLVPRVSSEKRRYIPIGFITPDIISSDSVHIIPNATLYHFGVLTSNVHMAWMRAVAGRLKSDYRYSKDIVYNNFPWPGAIAQEIGSRSEETGDRNDKIGDRSEKVDTNSYESRIAATAQAILDARAKYPDSSLADLYNETLMPADLRKAHRENDKAVMSAYGFDAKMTESEIVAELFKLYEKLAQKA